MIGREIGRYRITGEIGRGGMGVVYRATQLTLDRTVAVKMLPEHLAANDEYMARFRREAQTLARLAHPGIVHIYDVEQQGGAHFIVMEYVDGPSLSGLIRRGGRLSPARARDVAHALADALSAAHRKGIIHRDIKPDNVLFTSEGRPKLTDFGIAHMRDSNVRTQVGTLIGTPYYMSPEQAAGKPITVASDLYSLGVVLYEMLSGHVPFDADTPVAVALKHVKEAPPPLSRLAPDTPPGLCRVVERLLTKEPSARFRDARVLQRALAALDLGVPLGETLDPSAPGPVCGGCGEPLRPEFLTCPRCGESTWTAPVPPLAPVIGPGTRVREGVERGREAARAVFASASRFATRLSHAGDRFLASARIFLAAARERREDSGELVRWLLTSVHERTRGLPAQVWIGLGFVGFALLLALIQAVAGASVSSSRLADGDVGTFIASGPPPSSGGSALSAVDERLDSRSAAPAPARRPGPSSSGPAAQGGSTPPGPPGFLSPVDSTAQGGTPEDGPIPSVGESPSPEEIPDFDEEAARGGILALIERQRRATEAGDLEAFLADLAPDLRNSSREEFERMLARTDSVRSETREVRIRFEGPDEAVVRIRVRLRVLPEGRTNWVTAFDDWVEWRVSRIDNRWMVTDVA